MISVEGRMSLRYLWGPNGDVHQTLGYSCSIQREDVCWAMHWGVINSKVKSKNMGGFTQAQMHRVRRDESRLGHWGMKKMLRTAQETEKVSSKG